MGNQVHWGARRKVGLFFLAHGMTTLSAGKRTDLGLSLFLINVTPKTAVE